MSYQAKKILVTGGAGFIGAHFIQHMLASHRDINIINLDKLTYAANLTVLDDLKGNANHTFIQGDICDQTLVAKLLRDVDIDTVVNFAAESHVDRSIESPDQFVQTNIVGTQHLMDCALPFWQERFDLNPAHCRFHQVSTDEVYGSLKADEPAFTEHSRYQPNSPYSASKASADMLVRAYWKTYKLPVTLSNCSNNYGLNQHEEKLIPKIIRCCLESRPIPIYSDGSNIRDWISTRDHCRAIDAILQQGDIGSHYNVGADCEISNLNLAKLICALLDDKYPENKPHSQLITFTADRPGHDWRYAIDSTRLKQRTGWHPQSALRQELLTMIEAMEMSYA